ncbi:hypothetical protein B4100_2103 [Heyndrickxia coagulans]|jgi:hypothetical protein|uniref:Uncharacterized protein n=1 Tax=Heyndrickxia coagulans TaxID=1398 RepID=A0A150JS67_HEYCO|nr:hypothetical protein B4100_2103 [Heyndrickxia coagulans]KYC67607.1 hypothetical protein B4099_2096 [Heyndrickxia coagulans]
MSSFIISDGWRQFVVKKAGKYDAVFKRPVKGAAGFRSPGFSKRLQINGAL